METLLIMIAMGVIFNMVTRGSKKKGATDNKQAQTKQQQAIEEQRRRRAAYEAEQKRLEKLEYDLKTQRMFGIEPDEAKAETKAEAETEVYEPHHIDEEEERRCAEATAKKERERKYSQRELKRELLQRYGSLEQRQSQKPRPQSLAQAQQQLYTPVNAQQNTAPISSRPRITQAGSYGSQGSSGSYSSLPMHSNPVVQGIIMAEILGKPRAKKRTVR